MSPHNLWSPLLWGDLIIVNAREGGSWGLDLNDQVTPFLEGDDMKKGVTFVIYIVDCRESVQSQGRRVKKAGLLHLKHWPPASKATDGIFGHNLYPGKLN